MTAQKVVKFFKYYKGEAENPFIQKDENAALWWNGERHLLENLKNEPGFWNRMKCSYNEALENGDCSDVLADMSIPKEKRIIVYFLDLWHGKWFPYDSWDTIKEY